ncbi:AMP-dependent synthetase [Nostoc sp. C057]|uniref:condensation domain-containing protein n=1 Tax=Nostoc sp. C057 TaxID=2576903 RepID=UPI0015C3466E|nr:condensation domain-containing protein [Nostoc sp. C057]QLE49539.1 AMP-dependent synthetase [Nostoc sp. C057]
MAIQIKDFKGIDPNFTIVDLLHQRSLTQPDTIAFTFLEDGETQESTLTYQQLVKRSCAIASQLQALNLNGERALLLYPPGLDYLTAFFGCLYAGVVAVPAYPPLNQRKTPRISAITKDAQPSIALTTTAMLPTLQSIFAQAANLESLQWLTTDDIAPGLEDAWQQTQINPDTLAFLQYTSGSTGIPKGVMLSHGNLLHNAAMTYQIMEHSPSSKFVSWLPVYHDMGLIGGILQPLYGGFPCILMSPTAFLQRPYRWLQAISYYKGTTSGAPNFAYELCIQKITPEQKETLDLSSWSVAFNGAEPIRQDTLERFAEAFAECGFRREAFYPCYGMAEATLMISGGVKKAVPPCITVVKSALSRNRVVEANTDSEDIQSFVSCGQTLPQQQIAIANPETLTPCQPDEVGEIWVSGPSVGQGYWHRQQETEQIFHAYLQGTGVSTTLGPFLRTGDLGFLHNGELFITGRAKDLIIIRGRNLYPQDIELTTECSHPSLRLGSCAAFAVEVAHEERLVVVQELEFRAKPNFEEVTAAIRQAVAEVHEVQVYAVVLIKAGSIPKTSSGKIQRRATKANFLANKLKVISQSILDSADDLENKTNLSREAIMATAPETRLPLLISYLQKQIAQILKVEVSQVKPEQPLNSLGIDSLIVFDLKNRIQVDFEVAISVEDFFQDASVVLLAMQILSQLTITKSSEPLLQPISRNQELPLCLSQERLWFLNQLEPNNPFYNVPIAIRLTGKLHQATLEQSLNEVVQRHEALRTSFVSVKGRPVQVITPSVKLTLPVLELPEATVAEVLRFATEFAQKPFDLSQSPLLRVQLLYLKPEEHILLLTMHHIIADGWSIGILIQELAEIYQAISHDLPSLLPKLPIQYADFADWQRKWLQGEILHTQLDYWKQQLSGNLSVLQLTTDRPRPAIQTFAGKKQFLAFPKALSEAVKELNQREGVTQFMTLIAVFKTLLYCYTNQQEILVGSPVAGRTRAETQGIIGFFINTLVLRTNLSGNPSFRTLLGRVREVALGAYAHQELPFEKLVEELQPERDLSHNPLFQVMFILQNAPIPSIEFPELTLHPLEVDSGTSKFDLKFSIWESTEGFNGSLEYKTDLFDDKTIGRMIIHFEILLRNVVEQPDIRLNELAEIIVTSDREQQQIKEKELEFTSLEKLKLTKRKVIN